MMRFVDLNTKEIGALKEFFNDSSITETDKSIMLNIILIQKGRDIQEMDAQRTFLASGAFSLSAIYFFFHYNPDFFTNDMLYMLMLFAVAFGVNSYMKYKGVAKLRHERWEMEQHFSNSEVLNKMRRVYLY